MYLVPTVAWCIKGYKQAQWCSGDLLSEQLKHDLGTLSSHKKELNGHCYLIKAFLPVCQAQT